MHKVNDYGSHLTSQMDHQVFRETSLAWHFFDKMAKDTNADSAERTHANWTWIQLLRTNRCVTYASKLMLLLVKI